MYSNVFELTREEQVSKNELMLRSIMAGTSIPSTRLPAQPQQPTAVLLLPVQPHVSPPSSASPSRVSSAPSPAVLTVSITTPTVPTIMPTDAPVIAPSVPTISTAALVASATPTAMHARRPLRMRLNCLHLPSRMQAPQAHWLLCLRQRFSSFERQTQTAGRSGLRRRIPTSRKQHSAKTSPPRL